MPNMFAQVSLVVVVVWGCVKLENVISKDAFFEIKSEISCLFYLCKFHFLELDFPKV